jgi:hypothetical protein
MSNTPNQTLLVHSLLKDLLPLRLPSFSKYTLRDLATFIDGRGIFVIKHVYDLVRCCERLVLKRAVAGQCFGNLTQDLEIPKQVPSLLIWHNEIRGRQREVPVHVWRGDPTALHAEQTITSGLDDEFVVSGLASLQRDDVFYPAGTPGSTGDPLERGAI